MSKALNSVLRKIGPIARQYLYENQSDTKKLLTDWASWQKGITTPGPRLSQSTINRIIAECTIRWREIDVSSMQRKISVNLGLEDLAMLNIDSAIGATDYPYNKMILFVWCFGWAPTTAVRKLNRDANSADTVLATAEARFAENILTLKTGK